MRRVRARVEGTVQGVGFRPFVYRLAAELGLAGYVLNDERGVLLEVEGGDARGRRLPAPARRGGAAAGGDRGGAPARRRAARASAASASSRARAAASRRALVSPDTATCDDCLRRAVRPRRPPLPLPVRQLHELRAALHDRARRPLRPAADDDGRLRDVPALPRRSTTTRPTAASTPSPTRARSAGRRCGCAGRRLRRRGAARRGRGAARGRGSSRSRASAATTSPASRRDEPAVARAARAQAPRGQAVRGDGARRRGRARAGRR